MFGLPTPTTLALGTASLGLVVAGVLGAYVYGQHVGYAEGAQAKQSEWDTDNLVRQGAERTARDADRDAGYALAAEFDKKAHDMEQQYASTRQQLATALRRKVVCPASGAVGDVVVPVDIIRGMFGTPAPADPAGSAPRSATAEPNAVVR
jgi:hypothetical protein